jgi:hypothetical protein
MMLRESNLTGAMKPGVLTRDVAGAWGEPYETAGSVIEIVDPLRTTAPTSGRKFEPAGGVAAPPRAGGDADGSAGSVVIAQQNVRPSRETRWAAKFAATPCPIRRDATVLASVTLNWNNSPLAVTLAETVPVAA